MGVLPWLVKRIQCAERLAQPEDQESFTLATLQISPYASLHWANPDLHFFFFIIRLLVQACVAVSSLPSFCRTLALRQPQALALGPCTLLVTPHRSERWVIRALQPFVPHWHLKHSYDPPQAPGFMPCA